MYELKEHNIMHFRFFGATHTHNSPLFWPLGNTFNCDSNMNKNIIYYKVIYKGVLSLIPISEYTYPHLHAEDKI